MSFPLELRDRLVAQGVGVSGVNIFISSAAIIPGAPSPIPNGDGPYLSIIELTGPAPMRTHNGIPLEQPTAQILVRAAAYDDARAMLLLAYNALGGAQGLYNLVLSGVNYISLKPSTTIQDIGEDAASRPMTAFHTEALKQPS